MTSVKLQGETSLTIDETDLAAILTEHFCGSSYDPLGDLRVEMVSHNQNSRDFTLTLMPKPQPEKDAA